MREHDTEWRDDASFFPWQELLGMLHRQWKLIIAVAILGTLGGSGLAFLQAPVYRAHSTIMLTSSRPVITVSPDANERPRIDPVTDQDLNSEVAMLTSSALVREVLEPYQNQIEPQGEESPGVVGSLLKAMRYALGLPGRAYRLLHGVAPVSAFDYYVESAAKLLSVAQVGRSNLLEVSYVDTDAQWSAQFVNSLVTHHVERHIRLNQQADTQRFFEEQRVVLSEKLQRAEAELRSFAEREGIDSVTERQAFLRARLGEAEAAFADAQTQLAEGSARADFLGKAMVAFPKNLTADASGTNDPRQAINQRIMELELQKSQLQAQYAPTSIRIAEIERQIADAKRLRAEADTATGIANPTRQNMEADLTQTKAQMAALTARIDALGTQAQGYRTQLEHLDTIASEQEHLQQEVTNQKQALQTYLKKEEEARFGHALDESRIVNVVIVEPAAVPGSPLPSKRSTTIALGVALSLCAALGLAFLRDRLDPSVKNATEAKKIAGLPVLADIPS